MRNRNTEMRAALALLVGVLPATSCTYRVERALTPPAEVRTLDHRSPYLKAHLPDGRVYVLSHWEADSVEAAVTGEGSLLDAQRRLIRSGTFRLPVDSVALFETNVRKPSGVTPGLVLMAGITAGVAGACLVNPKACFGSCPTFYAPGRDGEMELQAEGFSASIAPALEAVDVDMLLHTRPTDREYTLRVTNEALETHVIRRADLLALPHPPGGRVYMTSAGVFREAREPTSPSRCGALEGDCLKAVRAADGTEWSSAADSSDLAARETIELEFSDVPSGELGLVVVSRQTLMTTFLIYQALAYMGEDAGRWLAALDAGETARQMAGGMGRLLGGIEVLVADPGGGWMVVGQTGETGPIATDTRVVPLGRTSSTPLRVRLRLTRGLWRLDEVRLVALGDSVRPIRIRPRAVAREGTADPNALRELTDPDLSLVTMPGDQYEISYHLPEHPTRYELFLESKGYYLEWMRQEWMPEENRVQAARLLLDPASALRDLAPSFKEVEPELERLFWGSRYVHR